MYSIGRSISLMRSSIYKIYGSMGQQHPQVSRQRETGAMASGETSKRFAGAN